MDSSSLVGLGVNPPSEWLAHTSRSPLENIETIEKYYLEKRSVEMADVIVVTSAYPFSFLLGHIFRIKVAKIYGFGSTLMFSIVS